MIVCILQLYLLYSLHENRIVIEQELANPDQTERAGDPIGCVLFYSKSSQSKQKSGNFWFSKLPTTKNVDLVGSLFIFISKYSGL